MDRGCLGRRLQRSDQVKTGTEHNLLTCEVWERWECGNLPWQHLQEQVINTNTTATPLLIQPQSHEPK